MIERVIFDHICNSRCPINSFIDSPFIMASPCILHSFKMQEIQGLIAQLCLVTVAKV